MSSRVKLTVDQPDGELAMEFAKIIAAKWNRAHQWREYVSAAWEGVVRARKAGVDSISGLSRGAWFEVVHRLRTETGHRLSHHTYQFQEYEGDGYNGKGGQGASTSEYLVDYRSNIEDNPQVRMLRFWGETRYLRVQMPIRNRVVVYLYAVEGILMRVVGEMMGTSEGRVSQIVKDFQDAVDYAHQCNDDTNREDRGSSKGNSGGPASGGTGGEVEHAGDETEGDTTGSAPCECGDCTLADTVAPCGRSVTGTERDVGRGNGGESGEEASSHLHQRVGEGGVHPADQEVQAIVGGTDPGPVSTNTQALVRSGRRSVVTVESELPTDSRSKAAALRSSMLDGIGSKDVAEIVALVTRKAKTGDMKAIKVFLGLLGK